MAIKFFVINFSLFSINLFFIKNIIKIINRSEKIEYEKDYTTVEKHSGKINSLFYLYLRIRCSNGYNPRQEECRQSTFKVVKVMLCVRI